MFVKREYYQEEEVNHLNLETIVNDYKITNYTQTEIDKAGLDIYNITVYAREKHEFDLVYKLDKWLIQDVKYSIISSALSVGKD